jgi:DNA repair protein RecN (Recombination protein N)
MLTQIHIRHLVTIDELHLEFQPGSTVMTGETGAGKSILIDAIELALGSRADSDMVRPGFDKAEITLCFDISELKNAAHWLKECDLYQESNECILRRIIYRDGRSRSFINGSPTTLQPLRELGEMLIQIHGQHEHQSLLKSDMQRHLLDHYGDLTDLVLMVESLAKNFQILQQDIQELTQKSAERNARSEFLKFQLEEFEALHLAPDEFQSIDAEHKQLVHAGELMQNMNLALKFLTEEENHNALDSLNKAMEALESVQKVNPKIANWIDALKIAVIQISDTEDELHRYLDHMDLDPERLQWMEARMGTLFNMARKHKVNPQELFDLQQKLSSEYQALETSDARLQELNQQLEILRKEYFAKASELSINRQKAAKKLSLAITQTIQTLSLKNAEFAIHFERDPQPRVSTYGLEKIIFQIKTNTGQSLQPLAKIASGGELSRVGLAIYLATAGKHTTPTLIFDEVDVGVGGGTAEMVGKLIRQLADTHQILCITHQPQVAALQQQHIHVSKVHEKNSTLTSIRHLSPTEKIQELARMLGGIEMTEKTLAHARELVERGC